jgi:anti-sigma B factor antagonist
LPKQLALAPARGEQIAAAHVVVGSGPFAVGIRHRHGRYVVTMRGELDVATAPLLAAELQRIENRDPELLIVDLRGLSFLDLIGLRVILAAQQHARDRGYELGVVNGSGGVRRVIELVSGEELLNLVDDPARQTRMPYSLRAVGGCER